jgi:hypothetical protein
VSTRWDAPSANTHTAWFYSRTNIGRKWSYE